MPSTYLYVSETAAPIREKVVGYAQLAGLRISNWIATSVGLQILETLVPTVQTFTSVAAQAIRGFASLDTSTDPGDEDPYDLTNATLAPEPGYLSDMGSNFWGTDRILEDYATGLITFTNQGTGATTQTFAPYALTFQSIDADATGLAPTYRNTEAATYDLVGGGSLTPGGGGALTVGAGQAVYLPIQCEQAGTVGSAAATRITILANALPGVTVSNAAAVIGSGREGAVAYRDRCRIAPAATSPNGPADAYRYIALGARKNPTTLAVFYFPTASTTGLGADADGNLVAIPNATGISLGVTRVYVSKDSATGIVLIYFANDDGAVSTQDLADLSALFDAAYWPDCTTRSFNKAIETTVTVAATIKAKSGAGVTTAGIAAKVNTALAAFFKTVDIGGYDQTLGAGTLYADKVRSVIEQADPAIYQVTMSSPGGDVSLALGHFAKLAGTISAGNVTVV